jgi:hypothetical protein
MQMQKTGLFKIEIYHHTEQLEALQLRTAFEEILVQLEETQSQQ